MKTVWDLVKEKAIEVLSGESQGNAIYIIEGNTGYDVWSFPAYQSDSIEFGGYKVIDWINLEDEEVWDENEQVTQDKEAVTYHVDAMLEYDMFNEEAQLILEQVLQEESA